MFFYTQSSVLTQKNQKNNPGIFSMFSTLYLWKSMGFGVSKINPRVIFLIRKILKKLVKLFIWYHHIYIPNWKSFGWNQWKIKLLMYKSCFVRYQTPRGKNKIHSLFTQNYFIENCDQNKNSIKEHFNHI